MSSSSSSESESEWEEFEEDSNLNSSKRSFKLETPEEYTERCRKQREAKRLQRAKETPEEHEANLLKHREARRIRRALETPEQSAARLERERSRVRKTIIPGAIEAGTPKQACLKVFESPEDREIRLALTRELAEVKQQLELGYVLPTPTKLSRLDEPASELQETEPQSPEVRKKLPRKSKRSQKLRQSASWSEGDDYEEHCEYNSQDFIPTEIPEQKHIPLDSEPTEVNLELTEDNESSSEYFPMNPSDFYDECANDEFEENEALQKIQEDETIAEWTERVMQIQEPVIHPSNSDINSDLDSEYSDPDSDEEYTPTGCIRSSAKRGKRTRKNETDEQPTGNKKCNKTKKQQRLNEVPGESELRRQYMEIARRNKRLNETEEEKEIRCVKEAEHSRLRREFESPEQRVRRLAKDAERKRIKRGASGVRKTKVEQEDDESSDPVQLSAENYRKRKRLNETTEEKEQRLAKDAEQKRKRRAERTTIERAEQNRLRRQHETPEQRVRRLAKDAEQKRLKRRGTSEPFNVPRIERGAQETAEKDHKKRKRMNESAEERKLRLAKDAEQKRKKRAQCTPEQRAASLSKDAERKRLKRALSERGPARAKKGEGSGAEKVQQTDEEIAAMSAFKAQQILLLQAELAQKKAILENETPEQKTQRLAEKAAKDRQREIFKTLPKEEQAAITYKIHKQKIQALPIIEKVKRLDRLRELNRRSIVRLKTRLPPEEVEARRLKVLQAAKERNIMHKEQFNLYESLVNAEDIAKVLWDEAFQKCITFWFNYNNKCVSQEILNWRVHLYKTISDFNPAEYGTLSMDLMEQRAIRIKENLNIIRQMISTNGEKLSEYFTSKRFDFKRNKVKGLDNLNEEERKMKLKERLAKSKARFAKRYGNPAELEKYTEHCRMLWQQKTLGLTTKRGGLGGLGGSRKPGPGRPQGRPRLPKGFFNGCVYPISSEDYQEQQPPANTFQSHNYSGGDSGVGAYIDVLQDDDGHRNDHYEDNPWEPIAEAFESCDPSPSLNCPMGAGGTQELTCDICNKNFGHPEALKRHREFVHKRAKQLDKCPHCPQKFTKAEYLSRHIKRVHGELSGANPLPKRRVVDASAVVSTYTCYVCHKNFSTEDFLNQHFIARHPKFLDPSKGPSATCDLCEKIFPRKDDVRKHKKQVHSKIETIQCGYCTRRFQKMEKLQIHVDKFHNTSYNPSATKQRIYAERPFKCEFCTLSYTKLNQLEVHIALKHPHGPVTRTFCEFCGVEVNPKYINAHQRQKHPKETIQKNLAALSPFVEGMSKPLKKMNLLEMQLYIVSMVKWSTQKDRVRWGVEANRPSWWPITMPYDLLRTDARSKEEKEKVPWKEAMKQVIRNCYEFHGKQDLLVEFNADSCTEEVPCIDTTGNRKRRKRDPRPTRKKGAHWLKCPAKGCTERFREETGRDCHTRDCHPEFSAICEMCGKLMKPECMIRHMEASHGKNAAKTIREEIKEDLSMTKPLPCMNQLKLKLFVADMLKWSNGNNDNSRWIWGRGAEQPSWWPINLYPFTTVETDQRSEEQKLNGQSFTEVLKEIVRACFKHHGKEELLVEFNKPKGKTSNTRKIRRKRNQESEDNSDSDSQVDSDEEPKRLARSRVYRSSAIASARRKTQQNKKTAVTIHSNIDSYLERLKREASPCNVELLRATGVTKILVVALKRCENVESRILSKPSFKSDFDTGSDSNEDREFITNRKKVLSTSSARSARIRRSTRMRSLQKSESSDDDEIGVESSKKSESSENPYQNSDSDTVRDRTEDDEYEEEQYSELMDIGIKCEAEIKEEIPELEMEDVEIHPCHSVENIYDDLVAL